MYVLRHGAGDFRNLPRLQHRKKLIYLAGCIREGEEDLICDFAETYHIFDFHLLPPTRAAVLASGLRANSRTKLRQAGQQHDTGLLLQCMAVDALHLLLWAVTRDAKKRTPPPQSIARALMGEEKKENAENSAIQGFENPVDFELAWRMAGGG